MLLVALRTSEGTPGWPHLPPVTLVAPVGPSGHEQSGFARIY